MFTDHGTVSSSGIRVTNCVINFCPPLAASALAPLLVGYFGIRRHINTLVYTVGKVVGLFYKFVAIFGKKYGSFSSKLLSEFVSGYFKIKTKKLEGWRVKALVAGPLKK